MLTVKAPFATQCHSFPTVNPCSDFYHYFQFLIFIWMKSCNCHKFLTALRFIQVVACSSTFFVLFLFLCCICVVVFCCMSFSQFILLLVGIYFVSSFALINKFALNVLLHVLGGHMHSVLLSRDLEVKLLDNNSLCSFLNIASFPKWLYHVMLSSLAINESFQLLHISVYRQAM
jgi:hypothetical protein